MTELLYFDYASATPQSDASIAAMQKYLQQDFYNPSALYLAAKNVKAQLENLRATAAVTLQVRPSEIYFTAGSTEANNTIIHGIMNQYIEANMVASEIEHDSVVNAAKLYNHSLASVDKSGTLDLVKLNSTINDKTVLVSCMSANNEIGTIQPIAEISKLLTKIKKDRSSNGNPLPIYLHVDASQSFNYLPLLPHELGIDFAVVGGSKIYGPKQSALLYIKSGVRIKPLILGGGQEYGMRSGTENVAGIAGFVTALTDANVTRTAETNRLLEIRNQFISVLNNFVPKPILNGSLKHRLPNNIHVTFNGTDNETLVMQLDKKGIMIATGSACAASSDKPSHVLAAIGLSNKQARSSVRITFGRQTTALNIEKLLAELQATLHA